MIKLFVTDLDGCISYPFKTPDWDAINKIRELNLKSRDSIIIPPLSICTGRPFPYAEAVAQWLDVKLPFVFESAGLFMWDGHRIETALKNTEEELKPIRFMRTWLRDDVIPNFNGAVIEFTKMMDAGIVCPDEEVIKEIHELVLEKVADHYPDLEVHATEVSVNILMPGNDKLQGMKLLGEATGISLNEMAYIGDSSGDVPALKQVKMPFAPINAHQTAKDHGEVLQFETTLAVLDAYERIIEYNRSIEY
jgi:hydroxymethylpyrimidine pyrophosphatase-like HAD family hydrolase